MTRICECCGQTVKAKRAAKAPAVKALVASFKGYDDFAPALDAAKAAARAALGNRWDLVLGATAIARVPAAWTRCKVYGRTSTGPRDMRLPVAEFWPSGVLPVGPEYAADYKREPSHNEAAETARRRHRAAIDYVRDMQRSNAGWTVCGWSHRQVHMTLAHAADCRTALVRAKRAASLAMAA